MTHFTPLVGSGPRRLWPSSALALVGLTFLSAHPATAQVFNPAGNSATVSGSGTVYDNGTSNSISSYDSASAANSYILNLQDGGTINSILTAKGGKANISGGTVQDLTIFSTSQTDNISGGSVASVTVNGGVVISGGTVGTVNVTGSGLGGIATIKGGTIKSLSAGQSNISSVTISGGSIGSFTSGAFNTISGGIINNFTTTGTGISPTTQISGGGFQFITNSGMNDIINITGTNLQEIGTPTDANNDGVFRLMGLLSDGEALNAQYTQSGTSNQLRFNGVAATPTPVPETSTVVSLGGMLLLGGAGLALRARKRARA